MTLSLIFTTDLKVIAEPAVNDRNLQVKLISKDIKFPTSMAFLGPNDILVLEKNEGTVRRIVNDKVLDKPLLDVNVANKEERGMLGIAISNQETKDGNKTKVYVFLYYTETKSKDGEDLEEGGVVLGNRLYRYELKDNKLVNPKILLDLPAEPGADHNGGVIHIGPDKYVYLVIGDVNHFNLAQNIIGGSKPDGTSAILRITQDGEPIGKGILGDTYPLNLYYAYGIRNSFGMGFDPVTGYLWDTENGFACCDEINLVKQGFNSGWAKVQGIFELNQTDRTEKLDIFNETLVKENFVDFDGKGVYSGPEFTWIKTVGPTAIRFFNSDNFGANYKNDMFVGNVHNQNIYHFDLDDNRTSLLLHGPLKDKIAGRPEELHDVLFAKGLGRITDLEVGPDGNLYVLSHSFNKAPYTGTGSIFKISKSDN